MLPPNTGEAMGLVLKISLWKSFRLGDCFIGDRRTKNKADAGVFERMDSDPTTDPHSVNGVH